MSAETWKITDLFTGQEVTPPPISYSGEPSQAWVDGWNAGMAGEPKTPPPWYSLPSEIADWCDGYEMAEKD